MHGQLHAVDRSQRARTRITFEDAVVSLRGDPRYADLIRDAYLEGDTRASALRFSRSAEFEQVRRILGGLENAAVVDLGAGNGIASYAFCKAGARKVYAIEPDPSTHVGRGAIQKLAADLPIEVLDGVGEKLPLADETVDVVYARQVLHHAWNLNAMTGECLRVLKPGGWFLACREHVVDDEPQLQEFLKRHPVHWLTGTENAFPLRSYVDSILAAGFELIKVLGPWDSVINAFPLVRSEAELEDYPRRALTQRLGRLGGALARVPFITSLTWAYLNRPTPGRFYSFIAARPKTVS